jgi:hypothetical protein
MPDLALSLRFQEAMWGPAESGVEIVIRCLSLFSRCLFGEISVFVFSCGRAQGT